MSPRTLEVYLYGPKPRTVEWLVIQLSHEAAERIVGQIASALRNIRLPDQDSLVQVTSEDGCLVIGWKWCHPALRVFLARVMRECPSAVMGIEERSELDLNGVWSGFR